MMLIIMVITIDAGISVIYKRNLVYTVFHQKSKYRLIKLDICQHFLKFARISNFSALCMIVIKMKPLIYVAA